MSDREDGNSREGLILTFKHLGQGIVYLHKLSGIFPKITASLFLTLPSKTDL
jgi:hypothetical protein